LAQAEAPVNAARETVLSAIRRARGLARPLPAYALPPLGGDLAALFARKARAAEATVHEIASLADIPLAVLALCGSENRGRLHLPASSPLRELAWDPGPGISLDATPPSGDDFALCLADAAIAETGTLVFFSGAASPSSWHFRAGTEIVLLHRGSILPRLEDLAELLGSSGTLPATVSLVTGPSRTADIEQTIELGAHGPRWLQILICN
jgi:LUD domain